YGIRMVTIDAGKGTDLSTTASAVTSEGVETQHAGSFPSDDTGDPSGLEAEDHAVHGLYREAQEAGDRIFADLEQGIPPPPAMTKLIVSRVLAQVMNHRSAL